MIELKDGTFTEQTPFNRELMDLFYGLAEKGEAVALHVGGWQALEDRKNKRGVEDRLRSLEEKVDSLETPTNQYFGLLHIPTREEIETIIKK